VAQAKNKTNARRPAKTSEKEGRNTVEDAIVLEELAPAAASPTDDPVPNPAARRALPLVLGGIIAGAIGFGAAVLLRPTAAPIAADTSVIQQRAAAMQAEILALNGQMSALSQRLAEGPTSQAFDGLVQGLDQANRVREVLSATLARLDARITKIENLPLAPTGNATLDKDLTALRQQSSEEMADLATRMAALEAAQDAAVASDEPNETNGIAQALAALEKAVNSGGSYENQLADMNDASVDIPAVLQQSADDGVVTLAELQAQFPDAARAALNASVRDQAGQGNGSRLGAFVKTQLGMRSLGPRPGDDANAILSRAEASLKAADITAALAEIRALSPDGAALMADWVALARLRQVVVAALAELSATIEN